MKENEGIKEREREREAIYEKERYDGGAGLKETTVLGRRKEFQLAGFNGSMMMMMMIHARQDYPIMNLYEYQSKCYSHKSCDPCNDL